ncbi:MAG: hypothetical protein GY773_21210 [Actinomycetia bacterium]|nr:hypothetical protein [Actinomycetes bacterium]
MPGRPTLAQGRGISHNDEMEDRSPASTLEWLMSPTCPPIRYLTARDLVAEPIPGRELEILRREIQQWEPLQQILRLQRDDGSFPPGQKTPTAQPTFTALTLFQRSAMDVNDEPVRRTVDYLTDNHLNKGAASYTSGGSGVLPCYLGTVALALIKMGAFDSELVQSSIQWLVNHQRFDTRSNKAGGEHPWPYKAPDNYGCWESVSCYHGVAAAFRAFAAIAPEKRSTDVQVRLEQAIEYLRPRRLYKKTTTDRPLFRHMKQLFLVGDYRFDLLDMLSGIADADPNLVDEDWVAEAVDDMNTLTVDGRVILAKNYGRKLIDPIPLEPVGEPSRFLTYQWVQTRRLLGLK